jgi:hypothetical protein
MINIFNKNEFFVIMDIKSIYSELLLRSEKKIEKIESNYTWNYFYSIGKIFI